MSTPLKPGYTIGVTLALRGEAGFAFFNNGLRQNVLFLYHLFKNAPHCARAVLVNVDKDEAPPLPPELGLPASDIVRLPQVMETLDCLIVLGGSVSREVLAKLRARGCRTVLYKAGNGGVIAMESVISDPPSPDAERYDDCDAFDELWMTPQHIHTYAGWCRTLYRRPVREVPQIWSPILSNMVPEKTRAAFGFRAQPGKPWRIGVMDPNTTVMKTSHMPMLVCEAAYRQRPAYLDNVYVTNAVRFADNVHFNRFAKALSATRDGKLSVEDRFVSWFFLANYCDAVVTHHWENGLNYLYYDVLWGNYPLIHNSAFLKDFGYYYEDFDADDGARALLEAFDSHAAGIEEYARRNRALFERLDPACPATIAVHEALLLAE